MSEHVCPYKALNTLKIARRVFVSVVQSKWTHEFRELEKDIVKRYTDYWDPCETKAVWIQSIWFFVQSYDPKGYDIFVVVQIV